VADDRTRATLKDWAFGRFAYGTFGVVGSGTVAGLAAAAYLLPAALRGPLLVLAALTSLGTAFALREVSAGRTERAVRGLIGLTAISLATAAGWLLPAAEPYRVSAVVGRRLAALEAREGTKSVLCTFQFPGTIFALGHPAPLVRSCAELIEAAGNRSKLLTALLPKELGTLRTEPGLAVEVLETVEGFNADKGRPETVYLAVIRCNGIPVGERSATTSRR
jgi:hypothetical protein